MSTRTVSICDGCKVEADPGAVHGWVRAVPMIGGGNSNALEFHSLECMAEHALQIRDAIAAREAAFKARGTVAGLPPGFEGFGDLIGKLEGMG